MQSCICFPCTLLIGFPYQWRTCLPQRNSSFHRHLTKSSPISSLIIDLTTMAWINAFLCTIGILPHWFEKSFNTYNGQLILGCIIMWTYFIWFSKIINIWYINSRLLFLLLMRKIASGNLASILVLSRKDIDLKPSFANILTCLVIFVIILSHAILRLKRNSGVGLSCRIRFSNKRICRKVAVSEKDICEREHDFP